MFACMVQPLRFSWLMSDTGQRDRFSCQWIGLVKPGAAADGLLFVIATMTVADSWRRRVAIMAHAMELTGRWWQRSCPLLRTARGVSSPIAPQPPALSPTPLQES